jgi:hypothetical protein
MIRKKNRPLQPENSFDRRRIKQLYKPSNFKRMKNILLLCVTALLAGSMARAQKYEIVMKLDNVETLRFRPDSVERMRLETPYYGEKKVGVTMKGKPEVVYNFATACVFTRVAGRPGGIAPVAEPAWTAWGEEAKLVISCPGGVVGRYGIYDFAGRLLKEGNEAGDRATVGMDAGGMYIVRIGGEARRVLIK